MEAILRSLDVRNEIIAETICGQKFTETFYDLQFSCATGNRSEIDVNFSDLSKLPFENFNADDEYEIEVKLTRKNKETKTF